MSFFGTTRHHNHTPTQTQNAKDNPLQSGTEERMFRDLETNKTENKTMGIGMTAYSSSDSLDERPQLRAKESMRSRSKPSKPPPSETESSKPEAGGGARC